ncbi:MAG: GIY-YIG nuclease family protein [Anaeromyxobacter sp.]
MTGSTADRRAELKRQAREEKPQAAVYQIRNLGTGQLLVERTPNVKTLNGRKVELSRGVHRNARLRADLAARGPGAFVFEVLEILEEPEDGLAYRNDALKQLEARWIERLQPWGERGYHDAPAGGQ